MGETSVIEWTHSTWNPWRGCTKVSPGCAECYMFRDQRRYGRDPEVVVRAADGTFLAPLRSKKWKEAQAEAIQKDGRHFVFTCSWSDWFHEAADPWREEAWDVIRQTPDSIYQVLTKRPERIQECLPADWGDGYPNVWLGTSIENRKFVDRADLLRGIPAAVRFISAEPLLGPLVPALHSDADYGNAWLPKLTARKFEINDDPGLDLTGIDWLIAGGESGGPTYRQLVYRAAANTGPWLTKRNAVEWLEDLLRACQATDTAFLLKQWGGPRPTSGGRLLRGREFNEMPGIPVGKGAGDGA